VVCAIITVFITRKLWVKNADHLVSVTLGQVGYQVSQIEGYKAIRSSNASTLYEAQLQIPAAYGSWPVYLIDLHGSRFQMGYDYGVMLANEIKTGWEDLQKNIMALAGNAWYDPVLFTVVNAAIDWQVKRACAPATILLKVVLVERFSQQRSPFRISRGDRGNCNRVH
jgi:hypothetical protein